MTIPTKKQTNSRTKRKRMVRKQVYIYPKQEEQLKRLAEQRAVTEAELIREALEKLLQQSTPITTTKWLPPNEAAWQAVLQSIRELKPDPERTEPYRWNREEIYAERMAKLLKHHEGDPA